MKNSILLIVFILLGSCSSNNDPTYRVLRVEDNKLLEASNKMLEKNYVLIYSFGNLKDAKHINFLYQKFSTVSNVVYLPKNEFYKDSLDFQGMTRYIHSAITNTLGSITTSPIFNVINNIKPDLLLKNTFNDINIYIPVYSPVFYQEILNRIGILAYGGVNHDFSEYHFKTIPRKDIITFNENGEVNIKKIENILNDLYVKENLLYTYIVGDQFVFIGEEYY